VRPPHERPRTQLTSYEDHCGPFKGIKLKKLNDDLAINIPYTEQSSGTHTPRSYAPQVELNVSNQTMSTPQVAVARAR